MMFDKCVYLGSHRPGQDTEYFHDLRKFPHAIPRDSVLISRPKTWFYLFSTLEKWGMERWRE